MQRPRSQTVGEVERLPGLIKARVLLGVPRTMLRNVNLVPELFLTPQHLVAHVCLPRQVLHTHRWPVQLLFEMHSQHTCCLVRNGSAPDAQRTLPGRTLHTLGLPLKRVSCSEQCIPHFGLDKPEFIHPAQN